MSTIDSILSIFEHFSDQIDNTSFNNRETWDNITTTISRVFIIESILDDKIKKPALFPKDIQEYKGACVDYREDITSKKVLDVLMIEFNNFYPNILSMLVEEELIPLDPPTNIYYFLTKNLKYLKSKLSPNGRACLKIYINYFFGKINTDYKSMILGRSHKILKHLSEYDGWIYTDTDTVYIKDYIGLKEKIKEDLDILQIPYEITYIKEFLTLGKKKVITIDSSTIGKISGFPIKKM